MLNVFRENLKSLKWVLWLVAISMILYLGAYFSCGPTGGGAGGGWAARIDGLEISRLELLNTARNLDQQYRQVFGQNYDQLRPSLQLGTRALDSLIERQIILEDARKLGLSASAEDVATLIRNDPTFQDANGEFIGTERYVDLVQRAGGVKDFETAVAEEAVIRKWDQMLGQSVSVSVTELEQVFRDRTVKTSLRYVVIPASTQQVEDNVLEPELAAWFNESPERYRRDERRSIRYVVIKRQQLADGIEITDEEISTFYEGNRANYQRPEQRHARHILLRVEPGSDEPQKAEVRQQAESLLARIQGGEDFATLAQSASQDPVSGPNGGDLGFFGRGAMVPPFEQAVFDTAVGQLAPVTESDFGFHVIEVLEARDAGVTPIEEVRDSIRRNLSQQRAEELLNSESERLRSEISTDPAQLESIATREQLIVESATITAADDLSDLGISPDFMTAVFDLEPGGVSSALRVVEGRALVVVDETIAAGVPTLDEVRDEVQTDLLAKRARDAALAAAQQAFDKHSDLDSVAKALTLDVQESGELAPNIPQLAGAGALPGSLRNSLFSDALQVGDRGVESVPEGALVYEVSDRQPFDPERFDSEKAALEVQERARRQSMLRQTILERLKGGREIETNFELVNRFNG